MSVCIYLVRPSPESAAHSTWDCTYTDSYMHAGRVAPWTEKQSSFIYWWDHQSSMSRRLGDWHWILQAPIGTRQIICRNFICQHSAITETTAKQHPLAIIWCILHWESPSFVGIASFCAINTRDASLHGISILFHILTSFMHIAPISLLTNRPCHGLLNGCRSRRTREFHFLDANSLIFVSNRQWYVVDFDFDCRCGSHFGVIASCFEGLIMWIHHSLADSLEDSGTCLTLLILHKLS